MERAVYAAAVDADVRTGWTLERASPTTLALAALGIDLGIDAVPWMGDSSYLSFALESAIPIATRVSHLLALLSGPIAIVAGVVLLRRSRATFAAGMFAAIGVILLTRVASGVFRAVDGWIWQTFAVLALQALEAAALFLAARRARREEPTRI